MSMEIVANQLADNQPSQAVKPVARRPVDEPAVQPRKGRSRVTNGRSHFVEHDSRGPWTRRWRDLLDQILCDLSSQDDANGLSEAQRQLARRCATLSIVCERLEGEAAAGHDIDLDQYGQLTDRLGRCFQRLGLKRQTPSGSVFGNSLKPTRGQQGSTRTLRHERTST